MDLMVDIETLALTPDAVVTSMAWVGFDSERIIFGSSHRLAWEYQMIRMKRRVDPETIKFHFQNIDAAKLWLAKGQDAPDVLFMPVYAFFQACQHADRIWAKPTRFDIVILNDLMRQLNPDWIDPYHKKYRDVHPLQDILKKEELPPDTDVAHDPLADCYWQIGVVQRAYKKIAAMEATHAKIEQTAKPVPAAIEETAAAATEAGGGWYSNDESPSA